VPQIATFPTKVLIGFDDEMISALDAWRREQEDLQSRSEAIRRLVTSGLGNAAAAPAKRPARTEEVPRKSTRPNRR
jgi:hypothetical protein